MRSIKFSVKVTFAFIFLLCFTSIQAQQITLKKNSYSIDHKNKLILWHVKNLKTDFNSETSKTEIVFNSKLKYLTELQNLSYKKSYKVEDGDNQYLLYITKVPIVNITLDTTTLNSDKKISGYFKYYNDSIFIESVMGIRQRGNLSLSFPKKSYDIEFWNDTISKANKDLKFGNLRSDDDWVLDGLYNEPLKVRAQVASELWAEIHQPYYSQKEPEAQSSFRSNYIELFVNGNYNGIYALSEQVDRKQLKLKKNKAIVVRGELFKANSYAGGPDFKKAGKFNNYFPHYVGFRMEYPVIDYNSYWNNLAEVLELVVNKTDADFKAEISSKIHIDNAIDYYLFINAIGAGDNFGKNYYLAKYNTNEPYFFVPWDLDSSFGLVQNAKKFTMTNRTFSNNLFDRFIKVNPNNYNDKLKKRWEALRASSLATDSFTKRFKTLYTEFTESKVYEREALIWPKSTTNEVDYKYLTEWMTDKLKFLDTYINSL